MKCLRCFVVFGLFGSCVSTQTRAQAAPVQLLLTAPSRMVDSKTLTLKAEILDADGRIDWRTCTQLGTVSATRVSDNSSVPISITVFESLFAGAGAGTPPAGSIRFYNGVGSVSITLNAGLLTAPGDIRVTVAVAGLSASKIVTVLDGEQPTLFKNLTGSLTGANLTWGPTDGVIHLIGDVYVNAGQTLTILPGTLVMAEPGLPTAGVAMFANGGVINALGTSINPIFFFPATGPLAMSLPQATQSNPSSWRGFYHSGAGTSAYSNVFVTGAGNGAVTGHPRPPIFRFADAHSVTMDNCVVADCPGMAHSALPGASGTYTIRNSLFSRNGIGGEWRGAGYSLTIEDCWFTRIGRAPEFNNVDGDILHVDQAGSSIHVRRSILTDCGDDMIDHSTGAQPVFDDCIIYDARDKAVSLDGSFGSSITMNNCLVYNTPGGMRCVGLPVFLTHCTIGQAVSVNVPSCTASVLDRSIIWPSLYSTCCGNVSYSLVGAGSNLSCGVGNFAADPLLVPQFSCNYELGAGSPAATAGPAHERIGWLGFPAARRGALLNGTLSAATANAGDTVNFDAMVQDAKGLHGYQAAISITRTSGTGSLSIDCPGGAIIDSSRPNYVFLGLSAPQSINCAAGSAGAAVLAGSIEVGSAARYLATFRLRASADASPGSTFAINLLGFGGSSLVDSAGGTIAFGVAPMSVLTITGCPNVFPGDMNADGTTNGDDIQWFQRAVMSQSTAPADVCPGDFTHNGVVAMEDIPGMVNRLLGN